LDGGVFLFNNRHATDFINSGIINVGNYPGSAINPAAFDNTGSIVVGEGGALTLQPATFTNLSGTTLTGGVYEVEAGASLTLVKTATITTDDATIILSGASSTITGAATIDASLTTIGAHGALELLAGRSFSGSAAFTNSGSLVLGGGTFTESSLTNAAGAKISGQGSIVPAVANSGTVEASGGALILEGAVSGTGNLTVDAGATLTLGAAAASTQTVRFGAGTGAATLEVADAAAFAGRVAGFGAGDAMDFTGLAYSASETLRYVANSGNTGGTLTVIDGTNTAHIALFGQYMAAGFQKMQDSGTGTTVTYTPPAAITPELAPHH
jgi:hypothetical protein